MDAATLSDHYHQYIALIRSREYTINTLAPFVHDDNVIFNGNPLSRQGYHDLIRGALGDPDSDIEVERLVVQDNNVVARIVFSRRPSEGTVIPGVVIRGRLVTAEHAIYRFEEGRIRQVWSIVESRPLDAAPK
jgi:predicted ester cyclase